MIPVNSVVSRIGELDRVPIRAGYPTVFLHDDDDSFEHTMNKHLVVDLTIPR